MFFEKPYLNDRKLGFSNRFGVVITFMFVVSNSNPKLEIPTDSTDKPGLLELIWSV